MTDIFYICMTKHGNFSGIHFLNVFLKAEKEELFFCPSNRSHNLDRKF